MKAILDWLADPDNTTKVIGIKNLGVVVGAIGAIAAGIYKLIASLKGLFANFFNKKKANKNNQLPFPMAA